MSDKESLPIQYDNSSLPGGPITNPRLTFDEFLQYSAEIDVKRFKNNEDIPEACSILHAAKAMRKTKTYGECYYFSVSNHPRLTKLFDLPKYIADQDLFERFFDRKGASVYLRSKQKIFYGFTEGYMSAPRSAYGGMSEWLNLFSGSLVVEVIKPTKINLLKYSCWTAEDKFVPEKNSSSVHNLTPGSFLVIPTGYLSVIRATSNSFALVGEFTCLESIPTQLNVFERDIEASGGRFLLARDMEIKNLYWQTALRLLDVDLRTLLNSLSEESVSYFRSQLIKWRRALDYVPDGLYEDLVTKRLNNHPRRSIDRKTNSIDILSDQTSTDYHTD